MICIGKHLYSIHTYYMIIYIGTNILDMFPYTGLGLTDADLHSEFKIVNTINSGHIGNYFPQRKVFIHTLTDLHSEFKIVNAGGVFR